MKYLYFVSYRYLDMLISDYRYLELLLLRRVDISHSKSDIARPTSLVVAEKCTIRNQRKHHLELPAIINSSPC